MFARRCRPWWQRVAAACFVVWFVGAAMDLPALHTCAMHGGLAMRMPAAPHATPSAVGHMHDHVHDHVHDAVHDGAQGLGHGPTRGPAHAGHLCTCLGACCGAVAPPPPAPAALAACSRIVDPPPTPGRPAYEYVAAWVDFVLPFSTAPPTAAAA